MAQIQRVICCRGICVSLSFRSWKSGVSLSFRRGNPVSVYLFGGNPVSVYLFARGKSGYSLSFCVWGKSGVSLSFRAGNPVSVYLFAREIRCQFIFSRLIRCRFIFSGKSGVGKSGVSLSFSRCNPMSVHLFLGKSGCRGSPVSVFFYLFLAVIRCRFFHLFFRENPVSGELIR